MSLYKWLAAIAAFAFTLTAQAAQIGGVTMEDKITLDGIGLVLNGAGVRTRFMFKVYAAGLYLPAATSNPEEIYALKGPKRVALRLMRDVSAAQLIDGLNEGLKNNATEAEIVRLAPRLAQFKETMAAIGEARENAVITLDWLPGTGTRVALDGAFRGAPIPGEDFYRAVLRIWLGDKPVQTDLKAGLLGKP